MSADQPGRTDSPWRLYGDLAAWWPLLSHPDDYAPEADVVWNLLTKYGDRPLRDLLELGSGGGNLASHLKKHAALTLVDVSEGMLDVSRALNPDCTHVAGDMRDVRLDRHFDAAYVHDAIMYMTTEVDLRRAVESAVRHVQPGGVALFIPDCTRETFRETTDRGGHDSAQDGSRRGLRYLQWDIDHDPADTEFTVHFAYMLRDDHGNVSHESEHHTFGLFPRATWLALIEETGCKVRTDTGPGGNEAFIALVPR